MRAHICLIINKNRGNFFRAEKSVLLKRACLENVLEISCLDQTFIFESFEINGFAGVPKLKEQLKYDFNPGLELIQLWVIQPQQMNH